MYMNVNIKIICLVIILIAILVISIIRIKKGPKYKLCVMTIFHSEGGYMEEFIDHHMKHGISHIYAYMNDPDRAAYSYLFDKYKDYVTVIPWIDKKNDGTNSVQRQAYYHCTKNFIDEFEYILMLDIDEFIISTERNTRVIDIINSIDRDTTKAIKVQRYDFGSSGHIKKPIGGVKENYVYREKICSSYKTIANSLFIDTEKKYYGVHDFPYNTRKGHIYNSYFNYENGGCPNGCTENSVNEIKLMICHYRTKSYDEYLERCTLWKNGGINPYLYRTDCKNTFHKYDHKTVYDKIQ